MRNIIYICIIVFLIGIFSMSRCSSVEIKNDRKVVELNNNEPNRNPYLIQNQEGKDVQPDCSSSKGRYHYTLLISNVHREWETYDTQELINGEIRLRKTSPDISYLNGYYEWDSDIYLPDENAMFNFICDNYEIMKQYKTTF